MSGDQTGLISEAIAVKKEDWRPIVRGVFTNAASVEASAGHFVVRLRDPELMGNATSYQLVKLNQNLEDLGAVVVSGDDAKRLGENLG